MTCWRADSELSRHGGEALRVVGIQIYHEELSAKSFKDSRVANHGLNLSL